MKKFIALAEILFTLELESISNDTSFHFEFNGWLDKFGESSIKFEPELTTVKADVKELAMILKKDFEAGEWTADEEGRLYHYLMPSFYCDFITSKLEVQLANLTGVGIQLQIEM